MRVKVCSSFLEGNEELGAKNALFSVGLSASVLFEGAMGAGSLALGTELCSTESGSCRLFTDCGEGEGMHAVNRWRYSCAALWRETCAWPAAIRRVFPSNVKSNDTAYSFRDGAQGTDDRTQNTGNRRQETFWTYRRDSRAASKSRCCWWFGCGRIPDPRLSAYTRSDWAGDAPMPENVARNKKIRIGEQVEAVVAGGAVRRSGSSRLVVVLSRLSLSHTGRRGLAGESAKMFGAAGFVQCCDQPESPV